MNTLLIIGDSHVGIYNHCTQSAFNIVKIIHSDSEDVIQNGRFIPYLMNTVGERGEIYIKQHYIITQTLII